MAEPEELISDAARHATVFARDLWRRYRPPPPGPRRLVLADVSPRLDMLVTAVFTTRHRLRVAQTPPPPSLLQTLRRRRSGPQAERALPATDGASVWLPAELGIADDTAAAGFYKTMALQQAMRARRGSARLPETDWPPLLADLYLLLEAYGADHALVELLPGFAASIDALRGAVLASRPPPAAFPAPRRPLELFARELLGSACLRPLQAAFVTASPEHSLRVAERIVAELAPDPRAQRAMGPRPLLKDWWTGELLAPARRDASAEIGSGDGEGDDDDAATRSARLRRRPDVRDPTEHEDDEDDDPGVWMVQEDDPHPHAEDPMGLKRPADRDEETSAEELADMVSDVPEARLVATPGTPKEVLLSDDAPDPGTKAGAADRRPAADSIVRYPEWDYRRSAYRDPGATVHLSTALPGPQSWIDDTLVAHGAMLGDIRRRFEMLRAKQMWLRRRLDGDEVDVDAFIEALADLRAGSSLPEALYATRRPADRNLAILLLIDVSGSTDGWVSANRRVIDVEREALLLVSIALDGLGERYAIEAFSGQGPQGVTLRSVKRFAEPYGNDVALRIASLEPERYTRAGAAIRHSTALLMRQPATHRLLLLLSDGKPNDVDQYEGRYGAEDMRQSVVEAKLQGVHPFCLTIDRQAAEYLPQVFGTNHYALLTRPELLPTVLLDWMRRLIAP